MTAILHGIAVSAGIGIGRAYFMNRSGGAGFRREKIAPEEVPQELARLDQAIAEVSADFARARESLPALVQDQAAIIDAHLLICRDPKLRRSVRAYIEKDLMNAEWALDKAARDLAGIFDALEAPYIRERIQDILAVTGRVAGRLAGRSPRLREGQERIILLAHDLTAADTLALSPDRIISFATELGGKTAHAGILARSLRIPSVVGVSGLEEEIRDGDLVVVDGLKGLVAVNPDDVELNSYLALQNQFEAYEAQIMGTAALPAETEDGICITVRANIEFAAEAEQVAGLGGEGVGLYRTEFEFLSRSELPSETELFNNYSKVLKTLSPRRVTIRTLDVGADKLLSQQRLEEENPAMGLRAIRYCLRHQDIFRRQLRAILRASVEGNCAIMFPLVSSVRELRQAKSILNEVRQELEAAGIPFDRGLPVGIMIELPAAVLIADILAAEADFFSIGTNDLIQYSLGIDRGNKHVAHLYQPLHPAVVRSIKYVADMAHRHGIPVAVCGEMASDPYCLPVLLGMHIDEISVTLQAIPGLKHLIRRSRLDECRRLVRDLNATVSTRGVNRLVRQSVYQRFPEELAFFSSTMDAEF